MPRPQHEIDIFRDRRSWWRLYRFLVYQRTGRAHFYLLFWRIFIVAIAFLDDREEFETECFWKKMLTPLPRGHARIIDVAQFHAWLSTFYSFLKPQPLSRILKLSICVHRLFFYNKYMLNFKCKCFIGIWSISSLSRSRHYFNRKVAM